MANLTSIDVLPDPNSLHKGQTMYYVAFGHYDDSTSQNITNIVTWISNDEDVATVSSAGAVKAIDIGQTEIVAIYDLIESNKAVITVTAAIMINWEVIPQSLAIKVGGEPLQLLVNKVYTDGSKVAATLQSCSSSDETIATVTNTGLVTAVSSGLSVITINVLDDDNNPVALGSYVLVQPTITKNYITNGQFQRFNDYIIPDTGRINISHASKDYPFYIMGKEEIEIDAPAGGYPNVYPNFGKILFYKTGTIDGTDYFLINTITSDLATGSAQYAGLHYCTSYSSALRWYEFPCASITQFNNEDVKIKGSFANVSQAANITIDIYYRQFYSSSEDLYVAAPISLVLQPSVDPSNPDIINFEDTINIQAIDHTKITKDSFFSLVFKITCDSTDFVLGFTNIELLNTKDKSNTPIDAVNAYFKASQLPEVNSISSLSNIGSVLTQISDINTVANYVTYNASTLEYKSILPAGTILPYDGGTTGLVEQSLVQDGFLFLWGTTVSRTRFQKLFTQQCQSGSVPKYGWGADGHITAKVATSIHPGWAQITVPLTYPPSGTTSVTGLSGFSVDVTGTDTFYYTYIGCPDGASIYNDITNGGGYIHFYATNREYYIIFVVNGLIIMPYITPMLPIDINQVNVVYVDITDTMTSAEVTSALVSACNPMVFQIGDFRGAFLRGCDLGAGIDPDAATRTAPFAGTAAGSGSFQSSAMTTHTHAYNNLNVQYDAGGAGTTFAMQHVVVDMPSQTPCTNLFVGSLSNSGTSTESRPPNIYTNWIQKY